LRLHSYLKAALLVELSDRGDRYVFDWRGEEPKVTPFEGKGPVEINEAGATTGIDAVISLSEPNLMAVRSGDLNPQVAMIADKIKVRGKMSPAVYLFNLIAPRVRD
jgi:putative sterol carrier protein